MTQTPETTLADRLYDVAFFLVEAIAALEVTAVIVASTRIAVSLGLSEELSSYLISSYLYPLFLVMLLVLAYAREINRKFHPARFFLAGLGLFAAGNVVCAACNAPPAFFVGRVVMGVGGAIAFAGQLWTLSAYQRARMTRTLVWGEAGASLGVVAGPLVGSLFVELAPQGWRGFFVLNATVGLATALFAWIALKGRARPGEESQGQTPVAPIPHAGRRIARLMTGWQVAVSILIVGAEYLFSDYLQTKAGKSAAFVGGMTVLASIGAILGSLWAARKQHRMERIPHRSAVGLLVMLAVMAWCLATNSFLLAGIPIFGAGLCMGLASVSIYARIVTASDPSAFLRRSLVYLIAMQVGNALGVQAVGIANHLHLGVVATAALLAVLPVAITVWITVDVAVHLARAREQKGDSPPLTRPPIR